MARPSRIASPSSPEPPPRSGVPYAPTLPRAHELLDEQVTAGDAEYLASLRQLLTCTQIAQILGVTRGRVRQLIATTALPSTKIGRSRYVTVADLEHYQSLRRPVGRPGGATRYTWTVLGHRRKVVYPSKNDYVGKRRRERAREKRLRDELAEQERAS